MNSCVGIVDSNATPRVMQALATTVKLADFLYAGLFVLVRVNCRVCVPIGYEIGVKIETLLSGFDIVSYSWVTAETV